VNRFRRTGGIAAVLLNRLNDDLPRALQINADLQRGERLAEHDLGFLLRVAEQSHSLHRHLRAHRDYWPLLGKLAALLAETADTAHANELRGRPSDRRRERRRA
jgi:hypothetical protein